MTKNLKKLHLNFLFLFFDQNFILTIPGPLERTYKLQKITFTLQLNINYRFYHLNVSNYTQVQ
jgi:hypothetical protein